MLNLIGRISPFVSVMVVTQIIISTGLVFLIVSTTSNVFSAFLGIVVVLTIQTFFSMTLAWSLGGKIDVQPRARIGARSARK